MVWRPRVRAKRRRGAPKPDGVAAAQPFGRPGTGREGDFGGRERSPPGGVGGPGRERGRRGARAEPCRGLLPLRGRGGRNGVECPPNRNWWGRAGLRDLNRESAQFRAWLYDAALASAMRIQMPGAAAEVVRRIGWERGSAGAAQDVC